MSDNGQQVPLIERLQRVPEGAVWVETVAEHDMRGVGYAYTQNYPVGALCREAADRIAELEAALQAGRDLMAVVHRDGGHYREAHGDRKAADDAIAVVSKLRSELAAEREQRASSAPEDIARRFHDAYEYLAPQFGYSTRPESRVAWDELPQNLRDLMIAVVRNVLIEQPAADAD